MATIELEQVTKRYPDGHEAVKGIDLRVEDGEFLVLVGPSGCGKSTALRMVAGLESITQGTLRIGGRPMNRVAAQDRDIAMVFQNYALYPHMTVRANMTFSLKMKNMRKDEIARRVQETAKLVELEDHLDRKPGSLSGGQRQRVAMARAIVREPQAFLMDEPLSNLDAKLRVDMRGTLTRLQDRLATTTLYVTHDQVEAMTLGDRVAVMRDGTIQQLDTPQSVYDRPANLFVAGFIGSPAMNLLDGVIEDGAVSTALGRIPVEGGLASRLDPNVTRGTRVVVGIRPEDFATGAGGGGGGAGDGAVWTLAPRVELVESLGSDLLVYFGERLVARLDPRCGARAGDVVPLVADPARFHVFAAEGDGRRLA
ncbi:MAG: transporter related protein [Conexibacter sp.]|nr:transporter related protein [Conexibacter sp.]